MYAYRTCEFSLKCLRILGCVHVKWGPEKKMVGAPVCPTPTHPTPQCGEWVLLADASLQGDATGNSGCTPVFAFYGWSESALKMFPFSYLKVNSWPPLAQSQVGRGLEDNVGQSRNLSLTPMLSGWCPCLCQVSHSPEAFCLTPSQVSTPSFLLGREGDIFVAG